MHTDERNGTLTLQSTDPHQQPRIDYRYLEGESDRARARYAIRLGVELLSSRAFAPLAKRRTSPSDEDLRTDTALDAWLRRTLATALHTSASAHMGPSSDPDAVVDQNCRVHGVDGLRVVDASAFPSPVTRGPNATAVMFGERAAALFDDAG